MSRYKALCINEIEDITVYDDENDVNGSIDIVELPPDRVDEVSDCDDLDKNILEDTLPTDVPGTLDVHTTQENKDPPNKVQTIT